MRTGMFLFCLFLVTGCATGGSNGNSNGSGKNTRSVLEITWGDDWRKLDQPKSMVDYYSGQTKRVNSDGTANPLLDQITFQDKGSNQPTGKLLSKEQDETALIRHDGERIRLTDYRGEPLILVFTRGFPGYICPHCTTYTAQIASRYDEIKKLGAEVILVFPGDKTKIDKFIECARIIQEKNGEGALPFPVVLDPDLKATDRFNLRHKLAKPATIILDDFGVVKYSYVGLRPHERPSVERVMKELKVIVEAGR